MDAPVHNDINDLIPLEMDRSAWIAMAGRLQVHPTVRSFQMNTSGDLPEDLSCLGELRFNTKNLNDPEIIRLRKESS